MLLSAGQKGHRYTFPHAKISTAPPILNRVFGQTVDAQLQVRGAPPACVWTVTECDGRVCLMLLRCTGSGELAAS